MPKELSSLSRTTVRIFFLSIYIGSSFSVPNFSEDYSATDLDQGLDFGKAQVFDSPHFQVSKMRFLRRLAQTREYLATVELREPIREICKNEHELCTAWAVHDECNKNPEGMKRICAPACLTCDYLDVETRCALDPNAPKAWEPGDLDAMFTRLSSEPYLSRYDVQILSSPETTGGPWVITLDNFLSKQEADILIELGKNFAQMIIFSVRDGTRPQNLRLICCRFFTSLLICLYH